MRGQVVSTLKEFDEFPIDKLGPRVRVDYSLGGEYGREWLRDLVGDLDEDRLVEIKERDGETVPRLQR